MGPIFMYSKYSRTSELQRLLLNFTGKKNVKRSDKYVVLSILSIYYA